MLLSADDDWWQCVAVLHWLIVLRTSCNHMLADWHVPACGRQVLKLDNDVQCKYTGICTCMRALSSMGTI